MAYSRNSLSRGLASISCLGRRQAARYVASSRATIGSYGGRTSLPQVASMDSRAMVRKAKKGSFDPKLFLATVGEGRTVTALRKNEIIFSQGDAADSVFYIQTGPMLNGSCSCRASSLRRSGALQSITRRSSLAWRPEWQAAR